jgi:hypothetical protein
MAPRESVPVKVAVSKEDARKALDPNKIREAIPKEAFVKSKTLNHVLTGLLI